MKDSSREPTKSEPIKRNNHSYKMREKIFSSREQAANRFTVAEKELLVYNEHLLKCCWNSWMVHDKWVVVLKLFSCLNIHCLQQNAVVQVTGNPVVFYSGVIVSLYLQNYF